MFRRKIGMAATATAGFVALTCLSIQPVAAACVSATTGFTSTDFPDARQAVNGNVQSAIISARDQIQGTSLGPRTIPQLLRATRRPSEPSGMPGRLSGRSRLRRRQLRNGISVYGEPEATNMSAPRLAERH